MPNFIDIPITTDAPTLVDTATSTFATDLVANGVVGYTPNEANFEIIMFNVVAFAAATMVLVPASQVPAAIFRTFGTQLENLPYQNAATATATSTWTLTDTSGHTIPGGTQVTINGFGFYVETDVVVGATTTATVALVAVAGGADYNGQSGTAQLVDALNFIVSVVITAPSSGGIDQQVDADYQDELANQLSLQAPRPITAPDFAAFSLDAPVATVGTQVGRATAIDGFDPTAHTFTGTTHTTTSVTAVSSFTGITVGSIITGADIPANTTVATVNVGGSSLTLSHAATGSNSGETLTTTGSYGNERTVTVFVTDTTGAALSGGDMTALDTYLQGFREVNFLVYVKAPTFTKVYITYEIHVLPGYASSTVLANVNTALLNFFNPLLFANPLTGAGAGGQAWSDPTLGFTTIRYNKVLGVIQSVPGVDYVPPGSTGLAIGLTASPSGTADVLLPGPAPLPQTNLTDPTVIGSAV